MNNSTRKSASIYTDISTDLLNVLDTHFLKALCEPSRVEIIRKLIVLGPSDVGTIATGLKLDRSVVSRHLALLERAGITAVLKDGRRVLYDLDGPHIVGKVSMILESISPMESLCVPFTTLETKGTTKSNG